MKRKLLFLSLVCYACMCQLYAQTAPSSIISPAGGYSKIDLYSLEWTIGETIATTYMVDNAVYTQGFNQPWMMFKKLFVKNPVNQCNVIASPNPVITNLKIYIDSDIKSIRSVMITDLSGANIYQKYLDIKSQNLQINMQSLPQAVYLLRVVDTDDKVINSTKIIKL